MAHKYSMWGWGGGGGVGWGGGERGEGPEMHGGEEGAGCDSGTHKHSQQELDP